MPSVLDGLIKDADLQPDVQLQPHQKRVLDRFKDHQGRLLLMHALGSGKSLTGIASAEQTGLPYTAVVPASLRNNMRKELDKFLDEDSKRKADVVSYTGLAQGKPIRNNKVLFFDEAHRLRNPGSMQTQRAMDLAARAKQVALLTGTPIVNDPSDLAVPMSMLTGKQITPKDFTERYVGKKPVNPGLWGWLRGVPSASEPVIKRPNELRALLQGHVDYYAPQQGTVPTTHEDVPVEMSTDQARLYHAMWGELPWLLRWKLQHDYPLSSDDLRRATSFLVGPRQVGLSTYTFMGDHRNAIKAFQTSTKLQEAYKRLHEKLNDKRTKALVFSNFIDAGLTPYAAGLAANNIPHAMFHGGLSDKERKKLVDDFNVGKIRVALLGPSGSEGLSFKGTQLVQLLDPYWNSVRGRQSEGRALRYDSHWDLPEDLKNVTVQRYISKLPLGFMGRMKERFGFEQEHARRAADDYLENMAGRKDKLNKQFIDLLKDVGSEKSASYRIGPSKIHGKGIHATERLSANTPLGPALLRINNTGNADEDFVRSPLGRFINHSDQPNVTLVDHGHSYHLVTARDILPDEELVANYKQFPGAAVPNEKEAQNWLPPGYNIDVLKEGPGRTFTLYHGGKPVGGLRLVKGKDTHSIEDVYLHPEHRTPELGQALASHIQHDHAGQNIMLPDGGMIPIDVLTGAYGAGGFGALPPLAEKPTEIEDEQRDKEAADEMEQQAKNWVKHVMQTSFATYPPPGVFTRSPEEIADAGDQPGVAPKGLTSWQRMVLFHRNRGGKGLSEERRQALHNAIQMLSQRRVERRQQPELYDAETLLPIKQGSVVAHIAGPSGSGKSTLLEQLTANHPDIVTKDLDEFDEEATNQLKLPPKWKTDYTDDMLQRLAVRRQELMDNWLKGQKQPVVLGGHHVEGKHVLNIPTDNKLLLNTPAWLSAWRGYRRSQHEDPQYRRKLTELPQDWWEARRDIKQLRSSGYKPASPEEIKALIASITTSEKEGAAHELPGNAAVCDHNACDAVHTVRPDNAPLHETGRETNAGRTGLLHLGTEDAGMAKTASKMNSAEQEEILGIPSRKVFGEPHLGLKPGSLVDYIVQRHEARRAGPHFDIRLGTPDTGLFSWASRKGVPEPGQKRLAIQQPVHSHSYGKFEGEIPSGYGAGKVYKHDTGRALVTKVGPDGSIHFTLAHTRFPERFLLLPPKTPGQKNWLMLNVTKTKHVPYKKVHYATIPPEQAEEVLGKLSPGSSVQQKIDGAASLTQLFKDHIEVLSYRQRKDTGGPIVHTERVFHGRPEANIPRDLVGTVLRGEVYGVKGRGKAIEPQEIGGILNSGVGKALETQKAQGIRMRNVLFDIDSLGSGVKAPDVRSLPYEQRMSKVHEIMQQLPRHDVFHTPQEAKTPEDALKMWHRIATGKDPLTNEGIVIHPTHGKPAKVKLRGEHDVFIREFFPGMGKYTDNAVGGFRYSHEPEGPIVGEVGTGLTDALRRDMHQNPQLYTGRVARVLSPRKLPSGALFAPALLGLHEDK
jgi:DNA ligase D-like protein (predicted 3'-phosphoesterase)